MFDKEKLAYLLKQAQGNRSLNGYALASDVSAAHLSRLMRCLLETPPTPQTLKKLATNARNGITYDMLMQACGHIEDEEIQPLNIPENLQEARIAFYGGVEGLKQEDIDKVSEFVDFLKSKHMD